MSLKSLFSISVLMLVFFIANAQESPGKYWIEFKDKDPAGNPYSIERPSEFLSQESITRRIRQGIALDISDLPVSPQYVREIQEAGFHIENSSKWFNRVSIRANRYELESLAALDFVKRIGPVKTLRRVEIENDNFNSSTLKVNDQGNAPLTDNQIDMLSLGFLHQQGFRGEGMRIAVLDAGFRGVNDTETYAHIMAKVTDTMNFNRPDTSVFAFSMHGSLVLSTMAGDIPGSFSGTAPGAEYMLYLTEVEAFERVLEEDLWVAGAERADMMGADIINSSLGYTTFDSEDSLNDHSYSDMDGNTTIITKGADMAAAKGILVINSAGNSGSNDWEYIGAPADGDSVLAIGAVDRYRNYAPFSSRGPSFDGRVKPNVAAQGLGAYVLDPSGVVYPSNGTSFSSPITAGATACLWQAFPSLSNMEIFRAIERSASQYLVPDDSLGYGIPNFQKAFLSLSGKPEMTENELISVFPNPFTSELYTFIKGRHDGEAVLNIFSYDGRLYQSVQVELASSEDKLISWPNIVSLAPGSYIITLYIDGVETGSVKLVKN